MKIMIVSGRPVYLDDDVFEWASKLKWHVHQKKGKKPYAVQNHPTQWKQLGRMVMGITDRSVIVDHRDGNTLDNQRSNLRYCTVGQNHCNAIAPFGRRFKGVYRHKNRWRARIQGIHLGSFLTEEDGAMAYDMIARELYGEFAKLNFP